MIFDNFFSNAIGIGCRRDNPMGASPCHAGLKESGSSAADLKACSKPQGFRR